MAGLPADLHNKISRGARPATKVAKYWHEWTMTEYLGFTTSCKRGGRHGSSTSDAARIQKLLRLLSGSSTRQRQTETNKVPASPKNARDLL